VSAGKGRPGRTVACPGCGKPALFAPENPWRPFCSERCRSLDLGAWAAETYRIPLREDDPDATLPEDENAGRRDPNTPGQ
jgi:endogenous inhibitor of DNA gyrase (YacG/DUF329 family)